MWVTNQRSTTVRVGSLRAFRRGNALEKKMSLRWGNGDDDDDDDDDDDGSDETSASDSDAC